MADDERITEVVSESSGTAGRSINHARDNHFFVDEPKFAGGPEEEITPEESFLTGISACGVSLVEKFAGEEDYPLERVEVEVEGIRDVDNSSDYKRIEMEFVLKGVNSEQAEELVEAYQGR